MTSRLRAMKCCKPSAMRMEAATRDIMALPGSVTIGTPAHSTSVALVCALTRGVSMNRSASFARCMYLQDTPFNPQLQGKPGEAGALRVFVRRTRKHHPGFGQAT